MGKERELEWNNQPLHFASFTVKSRQVKWCPKLKMGRTHLNNIYSWLMWRLLLIILTIHVKERPYPNPPDPNAIIFYPVTQKLITIRRIHPARDRQLEIKTTPREKMWRKMRCLISYSIDHCPGIIGDPFFFLVFLHPSLYKTNKHPTLFSQEDCITEQATAWAQCLNLVFTCSGSSPASHTYTQTH